MNDYDYKLLKLLDNQIQSCTKCTLWRNGRAKPFWAKESKYGIFLEAPGKDEVSQNTPVVGRAGTKLWQVMNDNELYREDFLIVNSVNCRPLVDTKNGKPLLEEILACSDWIRKYIRIIAPTKMLLMGRYSISAFEQLASIDLGVSSISMIDLNGWIKDINFFGNEMQLVLSVHPAYVIYNKAIGMDLLKLSIEIFKGL